jgi:transposase-like protein
MFGSGNDLNEFMEKLAKTRLICPKCGESFTFEDGVILAKKNGIQDGVLMCRKCRSIYSGDGVLSSKKLTVDVTAKYITSIQNNEPKKVTTQPSKPAQSAKNFSTAMALEIILGLFGIPGIGWIYSGNTTTGIILLVCYLLWDCVAIALVIGTSGVGVVCTLPLGILTVIVSSLFLNNYSKKYPEIFGNNKVGEHTNKEEPANETSPTSEIPVDDSLVDKTAKPKCGKCGSKIDHFGFSQDDAMQVLELRGQANETERRHAIMHSVGGTCPQCGKIYCSKCYYDQKYTCPNCKAKIPELGGK